MSVDVVVIGVGGFGRETLDVIEAHNTRVRELSCEQSELRVVGVADDSPSPTNLKRLQKRNYEFLGTTDRVIAEIAPQGFILAIGDPAIRSELDKKFVGARWNAVTVVHPTATLGSHSELGEGNIICAGAQISTNIQFGRQVHVNPNATVGHDTVLEDFVSVNPGAVISGEVTVRREALIGASAVVLQGIDIGDSCTVGANACVVRDAEPFTTVIGVPARPMESVDDPASFAEATRRADSGRTNGSQSVKICRYD